MAYQLIPFPLSILFVLVFGIAYLVVLWKLRKTGKIYSVLFKISIIVGIIVMAAFLYGIIVSIL
jgi:hypothetical protein